MLDYRYPHLLCRSPLPGCWYNERRGESTITSNLPFYRFSSTAICPVTLSFAFADETRLKRMQSIYWTYLWYASVESEMASRLLMDGLIFQIRSYHETPYFFDFSYSPLGKKLPVHT